MLCCSKRNVNVTELRRRIIRLGCHSLVYPLLSCWWTLPKSSLYVAWRNSRHGMLREWGPNLLQYQAYHKLVPLKPLQTSMIRGYLQHMRRESLERPLSPPITNSHNHSGNHQSLIHLKHLIAPINRYTVLSSSVTTSILYQHHATSIKLLSLEHLRTYFHRAGRQYIILVIWRWHPEIAANCALHNG